MRKFSNLLTGFIFFFSSAIAWAGVDSSVVGTVTDSDVIAVSGAQVQLVSATGQMLRESASEMAGNFSFFPVSFGSYQIHIQAQGYNSTTVTVNVGSDSAARVDVQLVRASDPVKEYVVNVKEKRNLVQATSSGSKTDISKDDIKTRPGGENISLPKLLASTTPGVVQGPFGQMFIRGNHANIQYQIDGVQLPDSMAGTFGDSFSPRNIDHMEVITGGISAEYGERLSAVMNIVTKSGPETPEGEAQISYGSYGTLNPQANYGGSDSSGRFRYYVAANYLQTSRGLDTPEPLNYDNQSRGGVDAVHDLGTANDQFVRLDYVFDNYNKYTVNLYNSIRFYQIPNFTSNFYPLDPYFSVNPPSGAYTDQFGNVGANSWTPPSTDNSQTETNSYIELVWKHTFSESAFLQVAPYYKRSGIQFSSDTVNDLNAYATANANANPSAINMNRTVDNYGLKADYTLRIGESHLVKSGFQAQQSNGAGNFSLQTSLTQPPTFYGTPDHGTIEAVYLQDSYAVFKPLTLNYGLRFSATQFNSVGLSTQDSLIQPRIGLEYLATDSTKLHVFYGKLFQPAPFEDLREAFQAVNGQSALVTPYDLKAEKDDFYEVGVAQQLGAAHLVKVNYYYKDATNMLDDTQLLNTSMAQPYNFEHGFAQGVEFSVSGNLDSHWAEFFNYAYEDARGEGIAGGSFAFTNSGAGQPPLGTYLFLDHVQLNTANAGLTYKTDSFWTTVQSLYGSGLRTRSDNGGALPGHATFDLTFGYSFHETSWCSKWHASLDLMNILNNAYPVTIANGFNGNHYAPGFEWFLHLAKDL